MKKKLRKKRYYRDGKALCLELWRWLHTFTPVIKWHNSSHTPCPGQVPGGDSMQELEKLGKDTGSLYTSFATSFGSNKCLKKGGKNEKKKTMPVSLLWVLVPGDTSQMSWPCKLND